MIDFSQAANVFYAISVGLSALFSLISTIISLLNRHNINRVERATNGLQDKLVETTKRASFAEGREAGRGEERNGTPYKQEATEVPHDNKPSRTRD